MQLRALLFMLVMAVTVGCGGGGPAKGLAVDTPILPYQAPDVAEITGIEEEEEEEEEGTAEPAPAPAPASGTGAALQQPKT